MVVLSKRKSISVKELSEKILNNEQIFILDVRSKESFEDWKIEGKSVHIINMPYSELKEDVNSIISDLSKKWKIMSYVLRGDPPKLLLR